MWLGAMASALAVALIDLDEAPICTTVMRRLRSAP
jgi:hypothetical protein